MGNASVGCGGGSSCQKRGRRAAWLLAAVLAVLMLAGCGTPRPPREKPASGALRPPDQGSLAAIAKASTPPGGLSGFRLLPLGPYALEARLQLIGRASHSLDLQYYVLEDDATGRLLLRSLRDAAERGVRVRLLLDDLFTSRTDPMLRALADHPRIEVRLFNPFCCLRGSTAGRFAGSLGDIYRLNHRMHNKAADRRRAVRVAGGAQHLRRVLHAQHEQQLRRHGRLRRRRRHQRSCRASSTSTGTGEVVWPVQAIVPAAVPPAQAAAEFERSVVDHAPPALPPVDALGYGPVGEDADGRIGLV